MNDMPNGRAVIESAISRSQNPEFLRRLQQEIDARMQECDTLDEKLRFIVAKLRALSDEYGAVFELIKKFQASAAAETRSSNVLQFKQEGE